MVIDLKFFSLIHLLYDGLNMIPLKSVKVSLCILYVLNVTKTELSGAKILFQLKVTYHLFLKRA